MNRRLTLLGLAAVAAGFAAIAGGWAGIQSTHVVAVQVSYLASGGVSGVALVILGSGLLRSDDLRSIREVLIELRDRIDDLEHDIADTREWAQGLDAKRIDLGDAALTESRVKG